MINNHEKRNSDDERSFLEERLAQLENGAVSTKHVNIIASAVGNNAVAIAGDANNAFIIAGNIKITREYHLPERARIQIVQKVQDSSRNRTIYSWLIVAISWMIPSLAFSIAVKDYSEKLFLTINQLFHYLLGFGSHFYSLYLIIIIIAIGLLLMIGYSKSGYALGQWLWKPLIFAFSLAIYHQIILNIMIYLRMISIQNFYSLCMIVIVIYSSLGSITVLNKEHNIRDDWIFYMASPVINFIHMHITLFRWLWKWK